MVPDKPLMLKDYLALDTESSNAGFQCYPRQANTGPTVRHLLDAELHRNVTLVRTRSTGNTLNKISSAIKLRFFQKQEGFLSRSLSKKLKGSFFGRRWQENDCKTRFEEDIEMERRSFNYPSPVVSSFRSWFEMENASEFVSGSGSGSEYPLASKEIGAVYREDNKTVQEKEYPMEQCLDVEKEQLSPVSVMDFPFEEEEEDDVATTTTSSPPFHRSTTNDTDKTEQHLVQKSRRFDNIDQLKPVNLEEEFNAVESRCYGLYSMDESESDMEWDLMLQLDSAENSEKLLLDFFTEGLSSNAQQMKLLHEARGWINNEGWRWEMRGSRGELEMQQMEKNGKWTCFDSEKPEVSMDLESIILRTLVLELVDDMLE